MERCVFCHGINGEHNRRCPDAGRPMSMSNTDRPADSEILSVVCESFDVEPSTAASWLSNFDPINAQRELAVSLGIAKPEKSNV